MKIKISLLGVFFSISLILAVENVSFGESGQLLNTPVSSSTASEETRPHHNNHYKRKALADEFSGQGYGTAGCGLGSMVFGEKPGMVQLFAATTNSYGVQTFAITSGTSNCEETEGHSRRTASLFILANREVLKKEISRGNGETLASLSKIIGCSDVGPFSMKLQENYSDIFFNKQNSSDQVADLIMDAVKKDPALSKSCHFTV